MRIRNALVLSLLMLCLLLIAPAAAQEGLATISFNGVSVTYDPALLGAAVFAGVQSAVAPDPNNPMPPGSVTPASTAILFYQLGLPVPDDIYFSSGLHVYRTADIETLGDERFAAELAAFRNLDLTADPASLTGTLPYLPVQPTVQALHAQAKVITTDTLAGIRYIGYSTLGVEPISEGNIWYTFQGMTSDGLYYVAFRYPVYTGVLPEVPADYNEAAFEDGYEAYLQTVIDALNNADGEMFVPALSVFDALVSSIEVEGS